MTVKKVQNRTTQAKGRHDSQRSSEPEQRKPEGDMLVWPEQPNSPSTAQLPEGEWLAQRVPFGVIHTNSSLVVR